MSTVCRSRAGSSGASGAATASRSMPDVSAAGLFTLPDGSAASFRTSPEASPAGRCSTRTTAAGRRSSAAVSRGCGATRSSVTLWVERSARATASGAAKRACGLRSQARATSSRWRSGSIARWGKGSSQSRRRASSRESGV